MAENKVQFNLKNVHYAILTETVSGGSVTYSYGIPVAVPGAVSLTLDQQGEINKFYADGVVYYQTSNNNGYEGDLEMAKFPDAMLEAVWGMTLNSTDKTLLEKADDVKKDFALLFQIDGDAGNECYVFYKCSATKPGVSAATNTETKDPQTQKSTISAVARGDDKIFARTTADTTSTIKTGWFNAVYDA